MRLHRFRWWALAALLAMAGSGRAQTVAEDAAEIPRIRPDVREIWVPSDRLAEVLARHPKAVLLSREEYETLLRDAKPTAAPAARAPREAVLVSAVYTGQPREKAFTGSGRLVVQVLSDEWVQLALPFGSLSLGAIKVEDQAPFTLTPVKAPHDDLANVDAKTQMKAPGVPTLLLRGRGEHVITIEFTAPLPNDAAGTHLQLRLPPASSTQFSFDLPAHSQVSGATAVLVEELPDKTHLTASLPARDPSLDLTWRPAANALAALPPAVELSTLYHIDADRIRSDVSAKLSSPVGGLPAKLDFTLPPGATVAEVTGPELAGWAVASGKLTATLQPGVRAETTLAITVEQPSLAGQPQVTLALPVISLTRAGSTSGRFFIAAESGVAVRSVTVDPTTTANPPPASSNLVGEWNFTSLPAAPLATVQRLRPRFSVDLDTAVDFQPEAIFLERTLTLHEEEGHLFSLLLTVPAGEEVLSIRDAKGLEPEWHREAGRLLIRWAGEDLAAGAPRSFTICTRTEPAGWTAAAAAQKQGAAGAPAPITFPVADLRVEGADRVTGYIALRAGENFRLEAEASDTLERRDGRTTPVLGSYAWFRRNEFALRVKVARRPNLTLATLTGYALPLAGTLDLHAQIAWQFLYSGVRSVQVKVPAATAASFNFDGEQIASRTLEGDTWTITFQKELTGPYAMSVEAQIPVTRGGENDAAHFSAELPVIQPLHAERLGGTWAIEANTDTEITLTAAGMNELDALAAPTLAGYQPRHRVIAVYNWLGATYALKLAGTRHEGAEVLNAVVDLFQIRSAAAQDGSIRTWSQLTMRTAGLQFLETTLPPGAKLLSLLVDEQPVKPVEGRPGELRVQLPARRIADQPTVITVLFENPPEKAWAKSGRAALPVLKLPARVPVLKTTWHAWLPYGYYLSGWQTNLQQVEERPPSPLVLAPVQFWYSFEAARSQLSVLGSSGIGDPRERPAPSAGAQQLLQKAVRIFHGREHADDFAPAQTHATADFEPPQIPQSSVNTQRIPRIKIPPVSPEERARIEKVLWSTILPKVEYRELPVGEVIEDLRKRSSLRITTEGLGAPDSKVTISLSTIPFGEALREITSLAGLKFHIVPGGLLLVPAAASPKAIVTQEWQVNPSLFGGFAGSVQDFLTKEGHLTFPPGTSARMASPSRLVVTNTQENLDLVNGLIQAETASLAANVPQISREEKQRVETLLEKTIIPKLELREATFLDAISYLQSFTTLRLTTAFDYNVPLPASSAVTIPGLEPGNVQPPTVAPAEARITVSLSSLPLGEALKYVTALANLKFKIVQGGVRIVPASASVDVLVTKEWRVPPGFLGDKAHLEHSVDAREFLLASGLTFPPGASAIFLPTQKRLIVRNTEENVDLIDAIVEAQAAAPREGVAGLLPMAIDLPVAGTEIAFAGLGAPAEVQFQYEQMAHRARRNWLWIVAGSVAFWLLGRRHPWWRLCWVTLLLSAFPLCLAPSTTAVCNALLIGWMAALLLQRFAARVVFRPAAARVDDLEEVHA